MDESNTITKLTVGKVYNWHEVNEIHRTRMGIYQRHERLVSLLTDFGQINACYQDFHGETAETIFYTGAGRRGDQKLNVHNRAIFNAIESRHPVPLFNKLRVGHWQFLGLWRVIEAKYVFDEITGRMIWRFLLERSN